MLSDNLYGIGFEAYSLGFPIELVRQAFALAASAGCRVAEIRAIHMQRASSDPIARSLTDVGHADDVKAGDDLDFSVGNSHDNFRWASSALAAGEFELAGRVAAAAFDLPDADYLSETSFCTPSDRCIAYALRHFLNGEPEAALDELDSLSPGRREIRFSDPANLALALKGLIKGDSLACLTGLRMHLEWFLKAAKSGANRENPEFYLDLPVQGILTLGTTRGLFSAEDVASLLPHVSVDLIDEAVTEGRTPVAAGFADHEAEFLEAVLDASHD